MGIPSNHPAILQAIERGLIAPSVPPKVDETPTQPKKVVHVQPMAWLSVSVLISPLRLASEANSRGKLRDKIARKSAVKSAVLAALPELRFPLPAVVTLTRLGGKRLDDDNLRRSFKAVRDVVAKWLGVDDADPKVKWRYRQRPGWVMGCRIQVREKR